MRSESCSRSRRLRTSATGVGAFLHTDATQAIGRTLGGRRSLEGRSPEPLRPQGLWPKGHRRPVRAIWSPDPAGDHRGRTGTWATRRHGADRTGGWLGQRVCTSAGQNESRTSGASLDCQLSLLAELSEGHPTMHLFGHPSMRIAGNLSIGFPGVRSEELVDRVSREIAISTGSACSSATAEPSKVLLALGLEPRGRRYRSPGQSGAFHHRKRHQSGSGRIPQRPGSGSLTK